MGVGRDHHAVKDRLGVGSEMGGFHSTRIFYNPDTHPQLEGALLF